MTKPSTNSIIRIAGYFTSHRRQFGLTLGLALGSTAFMLVVPLVIRNVIDAIMEDADTLLLLGGVGVVLVCFLGRDLLNMARIRVNNALEQKVLIDLRKDVHDKLLDMPVSYYESRPSGEVASRVIEDVQNVERVILDGTEQGMVALVMALGVMGMLFWLQPVLALLVVLPLPLLAVLGVNHARATRKNWSLVRKAAGSLNALLMEHLQGYKLISAFALHQRERSRFMERARVLKNTTLKAMYRWSYYSPGTSFISSLGTVAILGYGGYLLMTGEMTTGTFVGFYAYCAMLYEPITRLNSLNHLISAGKASGDRVVEILDSPNAIPEPEDPLPFPRQSTEAVFERVSFTYGDRDTVVRDFQLTMPAGKTTALVGHTGAGKSTIASLLLRYHDVCSGTLSIGGTDIRKFRLSDLRGNIGFVAQEPFLFDGTVEENLLLARPAASEKDLWEALEAANAREFVSRLPQKLQTQIGERGVRLSVGEKQRLTIARVILKNPPFVVLDEATASVDTLTEFHIQSALDRLMQNRTVLVIAHRLSTVKRADWIVVMKQGEIIERGSHGELLQNEGHYARLWSIQSDFIAESVE